MARSLTKILVTGADGFIGSHVVEDLARAGYSVRAFVLYNSFNSWGWLDEVPQAVRRQIEVVAGDIRDARFVREASRSMDAVLHLAALISIPYSYRAAESFVETNVRGTLNVLDAALDAALRRVVVTSTSEVYGTARSVPITEDHPLSAQSPYAATKIAADQLALSYYRAHGLPVTVLRPFNTYGPRQSARAIIPTIISQIASGKRAIRLGALHPTRDFTYVTDTAAAFRKALEAPRAEGETVQIGSQFEVTMGETAELLARIMKRKIRILEDPERRRPAKSEVERLWADASKARALIGWEPRYGGLGGFERGLRETVRWFRDPKHLGRYKAELCNI